MNTQFLPVSKADMRARGWEDCDFLIITGDAYVDHPSFGPAIISRVLEAEGYRVAVLAQPDWKDPAAFTALGRPRLGVMVSGGNIDSMVAHYTVAKKRRRDDAYSPGNQPGRRPDRATIVYANRIREVFGNIPLIIGGLEASLRRFAHYDYWEDKVRRSILFDSQADLLVYGMGETASRAIAARLASGTPVDQITDVRGTCFAGRHPGQCAYPMVEVPSFETVCADKRAYAQANQVEYEEHDAVRGKAILQKHGDRLLIANPPAMPLTTAELDAVFELPYVGEPHPMYDAMGGVPAIEEVRFSIIHNRGCFGACNFCSLAFHQGRTISARSHESVLREAERLVKHPGFKGYIHDVGLSEAAQGGHVPEPGLPVPPGLPQPGRRRDRLPQAAAGDPGHPRRQKGVHPLRHPVRLPDAGPGRGILRRAGEISRVRPAQGGPGALCQRGAGLHGKAPCGGL